MLYSISWMVTREPEPARPKVYRETLVLFLLGGLSGGAIMGGVIAVAARAVFVVTGSHPAIFLIAAGVVSAAYWGRSAGIWNVPKPQFRHQVPEAWRNVFRYRVASFIYAAGLGAVYFTRLGSLVAYPFAILLLGMGKSPLAIVEIAAAVGLVRAATALVLPLAHLDRASDESVPAWMNRRSNLVRRGEQLALVSLVVLPLTLLVSHAT